MGLYSKHTAALGSTVTYWTYNEGRGQTIVMVHGFRGTHHGLEEIINELSDFTIIIPDLPGFGQSSPMTKQKHDINGYCTFLELFIKKLALKKPVLLGHSFGSIIAAHFAAQYPQLIDKLILINPIASPALEGPRRLFTQLARFYYWLGEKLPEKPGRSLLANPAITYSTSVILAKTKDKNLRKHIHQKHLQHFSSFQAQSVLSEAFVASISHTAADHAEAIRMPTLLIAGDLDDIAPLQAQYALERRIPHAQLVILQKTGHLIHHEKPHQASQAVRRFLQR